MRRTNTSQIADEGNQLCLPKFSKFYFKIVFFAAFLFSSPMIHVYKHFKPYNHLSLLLKSIL